MQEAAFDATAAAGYDVNRYDSMDRIWLARETVIDIDALPVYGESIDVKTWVADFRKVRSIRLYELRKSGTDEIVGLAQTDWAFLEKSTGRPAPIPEELIAAFFPEGISTHAPGRDRFPSVPPPPEHEFAFARPVEWRDIDPARHINNSAYVSLIEDGAMQANHTFGWSHKRMLELGSRPVMRRIHIEYRQQAVMGDEIKLSSWAYEPARSTFSRVFKISSGRELITQAIAKFEWMDLSSLNAISIPSNFIKDCASNFSDA
jgi:acyl-CoA thioester hydrolase